MQSFTVELRYRMRYILFSRSLVGIVSYHYIWVLFFCFFREARLQNILGLIYTQLTTLFFVTFRLVFWIVVIGTFPFRLWQVYLFRRPALYRSGQYTLTRSLTVALFLLYLGILRIHKVVIPFLLTFFVYLQSEVITKVPGSSVIIYLTISHYFWFSWLAHCAWVVGWRASVTIILLIRTHLDYFSSKKVFSKKLKNWGQFRKYTVVVALITAAVLSPPDILSQFRLAGGLLLWVEFGFLFFLIARNIYRLLWSVNLDSK